MKVQITLDTCDAQDRDAFLALAQLLGGGTTVVADPMATEAHPTALERLQTILNGEEPAPSAEEPKFENTATTLPLEEPSPVVEEKAETPKTISVDEWKEILNAKRKELGLVNADGSSVGAPFASAKSEFIDFVTEQSKKYGADSPKFLAPEKLYQFVDEVFSKIVYDPATGFSTSSTPNVASF
jgi:hypothetical protein